MRVLVVGLFCCFASSNASAYPNQDWGGGYAGVGFNAQSSSDGDTKTIIDPGLDSRLTYVVLPPGRSYSADALESSAAPIAYAGWRRAVGGWVIGVEG